IHSPPVAAETSIDAHDSMARNRHRDGIRSACMRDGACRPWRPNPRGDFRIACRGTGRNFAERLPYPPLKCGPAHIERQIKTYFWRLDKTYDFADQALKFAVPAGQMSFRKAILKLPDKRIRIVSKRNRTNAFFG